MHRLADRMYPRQEPTPKRKEAIREVQELVRAWDAETDPARKATMLGALRRSTSGHQRHLATRHTPPGHPAFRPLMRALDALIRAGSEGRWVETAHGPFLIDELIALEVKIERENGRERIVFPVSYPWKVKPDPDNGQPGVRAPAIYRPPDQRGPRIHGFTAGAPPREGAALPPSPERHWYDEEDDDDA